MNTPAPLPPPTGAIVNGNPAAPVVLAPHAAIPWYQSPVVIAQVSSALSGTIAILPKKGLAVSLGLTDPDTVSGYVTLGFGVIAAIAQVIAFAARVRSTIQPVTLTQTGADMHPNTLALNAPVVEPKKEAVSPPH